jgi:hypothetical protein
MVLASPIPEFLTDRRGTSLRHDLSDVETLAPWQIDALVSQVGIALAGKKHKVTEEPTTLQIVLNNINPALRAALWRAFDEREGIKPQRFSMPDQIIVRLCALRKVIIDGEVFEIVFGARRKQMRSIIRRDGNLCVWCRTPLSEEHPNATLDHVIPDSQGGSDSCYNSLLACGACNSRRGCKSVIEWIAVCKDQGLSVQEELILNRLHEIEALAPLAA